MIIKTYAGYNLKELKFLGRGTQGSVYRIDSKRCIKVFKSSRVCMDEFKTLFIAQAYDQFPKLYFVGKNYIIRECINGIELDKYLRKYPLTPSMCMKIIELFDTMDKIGYRRLDSAIFHIFVTPQGSLRVIDTSKALRKKTRCPKLFLKGLEKSGYKEEFLNFVKNTRPDLYAKWK